MPLCLNGIPWQMVRHALGALGQEEELDVRTLGDDFPGLFPPGVCLGQKEVAGHADADHLTAFDLIPPLAVFGERIAEARLGAVDIRAALATQAVEVVHIAVLAALTALFAAMPGIPYIVHKGSPLSI